MKSNSKISNIIVIIIRYYNSWSVKCWVNNQAEKKLGHKHTQRIIAQCKVMKGKEQSHINLK